MLRVGGIYLVKPSMRELRESVGQELLQESEQENAALQIVKNWAGGDRRSLNRRGRSASRYRRRLPTNTTPSVPVKSKVGAGDSMVAGIVLALARNMSLHDAICFGIACGAAAVMMPGTQLCRRGRRGAIDLRRLPGDSFGQREDGPQRAGDSPLYIGRVTISRKQVGVWGTSQP